MKIDNSFVFMATAKKIELESKSLAKKKRAKSELESIVIDCLERGINRPFDIQKETGINQSHACRIMRRIGYHRIPITKAGTKPVMVRAIFDNGDTRVYASQVEAAKKNGYVSGWICKLIKTGKKTKKGIRFESICN